MNKRFVFSIFFFAFLALFSLGGTGLVFAQTSLSLQTVQVLQNVGFFKCSFLRGAYDPPTRSCFIETSPLTPLNARASVFDVAGSLFYTSKDIFNSVADIFRSFGFSDTTHTISLLPADKDISEGGTHDILLSEIENIYLRVTFEGIGKDGAPRIKLQMIQKFANGASSVPASSHVVELEGLDVKIAEGESIEIALTGTDILLSLTLSGVQNGVPNIIIDLIQ